ncbi:hypothetical protein ACS0TY_025541 [Phlomoides rotata]
MDGNSDTTPCGRGRKRVGATTSIVWTFVEECELMNALKELVSKGHKCDNEFRSGYLLLLENMLGIKFPGSDLKGEPHINSKIHLRPNRGCKPSAQLRVFQCHGHSSLLIHKFELLTFQA